MALGNVFMTDTDGNIGKPIPSSTDKVCGLLFDISGQSNLWTAGKGLAAKDSLQGNVVELNTYEDAALLGIAPFSNSETVTAATDFMNGIPDYHIKHYFSKCGGVGRLFVAFADCTNGWGALLDMQRASGGIISQFGVWTEKPLWGVSETSGGNYSINHVADINSICVQMANDYYAPASVLLSANTSRVAGTGASTTTIDLSKIPSCIVDSRYVTVLLGQSTETYVRSTQASLTSTANIGTIGLALGCLTVSNVGESIAWVQQYDLSGFISGIEMGFGNAAISNGRLTNSTEYSTLTKVQADTLDEKGYMFLRTYEGLEGRVYYTKDRTCSDGDYCTISRNRVINKSRRIIRASLLPYINSPVRVDPTTGQLSTAQMTVYKNLITSALESMQLAEEISAVGTINVPMEQNVLKNKKLLFSYSIIPLGCAESIEVTEGLVISR